MPSKTITIEDTPEAVAGRLPGFHLVNPTGLASSVRIHQEDAPAGLIYYRVHCGDIEAASAQIVLRIEKGKCVISLRYQHGLQVHGKPQPRDDLQRCKDFCAGFLTHLAAGTLRQSRLIRQLHLDPRNRQRRAQVRIYGWTM